MKKQPEKPANQFGSTSCMLNKELTNLINRDNVSIDVKETILDPVGSGPNDLIILEDVYGPYLTTNLFLDRNIADPNRYFGFDTPKGSDSTSISSTNFIRRFKLMSSALVESK
jgi:hypothetical protein